MLKRAAKFLASAALALVQVQSSVAWPAHGTPGNPAPPSYPGCPYGISAVNDGCQALYDAGLQGTVQYPNCFITASTCGGGGETYLSRLQENQAGVDYPIGVPASQGALIDPAISQPTNCTYSATGSSASGPKLTCGGGAVTIHGYEFGATGGHQAVVLRVNATATSEDIQYNHFGADSNTATSSDAGDYALFLAFQGSTFDSVFSHNTVEAGCAPSPGTCVGNYQIVAYTSGKKTWDYNAWINLPFRITAGCGSGTCATVGDTLMRWSLMIGPTASNVTSHGEWLEDIYAQSGTPTTQVNHSYIGIVSIIPAGAPAGLATANLYISGGAAPVGPPLYTNVNVTDSTLIASKTSGAVTTSALIDFQNGIYQNVTFQNLGTNQTGATGNFRADCNNSLFNVAIDGTTGIATVTGWISSWKKILTDTTAHVAVSSPATTTQFTSQLTGTTGQNGTYQTPYRGANIAVVSAIGYGGTQTASFTNPPVMSNVQNMLVAAPSNLLTTFNFKSFCASQIPNPP